MLKYAAALFIALVIPCSAQVVIGGSASLSGNVSVSEPAAPAGASTFSATPTTLAAGSVPASTTAPYQLVTVTNTGTAPLTFSSIGFTGTNASDFAETQGFAPAVNPVGGNTLPLCSTSSSVAPNGKCIVPVDFKPGASSARSAALSFSDNAAGSPHTVALTGTGVTASGTPLPACGSMLAANTTYYATGNITCPNSAYGINGAGIVVNLNGYTLSFGNAPTYSGAAQFGFYSASQYDNVFSGTTCSLSGASYKCGNGITPTPNFNGAATIENGTIMVGSGATSLATMQYGDAAIFTGANSGPNWNLHDLNVTIPLDCTTCQVVSGWLAADNTGNGVGYQIYKLNVADNSGFVNSRCNYEGSAIVLDGGAATSTTGPVVYENTIDHSPQTGVLIGTTYGHAFGNTIKDGNPNGTDAGTSSTCSGVGSSTNGTMSANGFAFEVTASNVYITNNTISNYEGRGIDMSSPNGAVGSISAAGNTINTTDLPNYVEYQGNNPAGCAEGGTYGERLNTFGTTSGPWSSTGDTTMVTATSCAGTGYSISSSNSASNSTQNGNYTCKFGNGRTAALNCYGMTNGDQDYVSGTPAMFYSIGETYTGDTADIAIGYAPTGMAGPWTITNPTFVKPSTAAPGSCGNPGTPLLPSWSVFSACFASLGTAYTIGPVYVNNPTWAGGAGESNLDDFATATADMTAGTTASIYIRYLYAVTVEKSSTSAPISGATVAVVDSKSGSECSATTNSSGVASCWLNENEYSFTAPNAPVTTNFSPMSATITASGCTTDNYSFSVGTSNITETRTLAGC